MSKNTLKSSASDKGNIKALAKRVEGKLIAVASGEQEDRVGEVVKADGWILKPYKQNPVIQPAHNYSAPPIGSARNIKVEGDKLIFEPVFHEITRIAREYKAMYESNPPIMRAFSVGFIPVKRDADNPSIITKQELLEISAVAVPASREALLVSKSYSEKTREKVNEWVKECVGDKCVIEKSNKDDELLDIDEKPYPSEHSCRLKDPSKFESGSFRATNRKHNGKRYRVIMGKIKGETAMTEQGYRYDKDAWTEAEAKKHCKDHKGIKFEAATGKSVQHYCRCVECEHEMVTNQPCSDITCQRCGGKMKEYIPGEDKTQKKDKEKYNCECVDCGYKMKSEKHCRHIKCPKCGGAMRRAERPGPGQKESTSEKNDKVKEEVKGAIPYSVHGDGPKSPENTPWDAGKEAKKASKNAERLMKMHAWVDNTADNFDADERKWYKLPHHKGDGSQSVIWRGVAAAMGALLGARGGVDIPSKDKKSVYNHLVKHYKQFDKEAPEFREYNLAELQAMFPAFYKEETIERQMNQLKDEIMQLKEGRVLSGTNRERISKTIFSLEETISALKNLLQATEPPQKEVEKKKSEQERSAPKSNAPRATSQKEKLNGNEVVLRALEKVVGKTIAPLEKRVSYLIRENKKGKNK